MHAQFKNNSQEMRDLIDYFVGRVVDFIIYFIAYLDKFEFSRGGGLTSHSRSPIQYTVYKYHVRGNDQELLLAWAVNSQTRNMPQVLVDKIIHLLFFLQRV